MGVISSVRDQCGDSDETPSGDATSSVGHARATSVRSAEAHVPESQHLSLCR